MGLQVTVFLHSYLTYDMSSFLLTYADVRSCTYSYFLYYTSLLLFSVFYVSRTKVNVLQIYIFLVIKY